MCLTKNDCHPKWQIFIPVRKANCPHPQEKVYHTLLLHISYPASKALSYFSSAWHREARETLQNLCIFFVEPTIQKLG
jgi:hypothetical protein